MTDAARLVKFLDQKILASSGVDSLEEIIKMFLIKLFDEIRNDNKYFKDAKFDNTNKTLLIASKEYPGIVAEKKFLLDEKVLHNCLAEVSKVTLFKESSEAFDTAIEYLLPHAHRGSRGQFMTPRHICQEVIKLLAPKVGESFLDPACGSGGFLEHAILFQSPKSRSEYANKRIHGSDYDEKMTRLARLTCLKNSKTDGNIRVENSLSKEDRENFYDIVVSNPPYGGKITDSEVLKSFSLSKDSKGKTKQTDKHILFLEKCIRLAKPGGKICIILPQGILNNARMERVHAYIFKTCRVIGVISLPQSTFMPHTNVKTSILVLKKWKGKNLEDYNVFMNISKKSGKDKKGKLIVKNNKIDHDFDNIQEKFKIFIKEEKLSW